MDRPKPTLGALNAVCLGGRSNRLAGYCLELWEALEEAAKTCCPKAKEVADRVLANWPEPDRFR
jgi:hypothetical protein